MNIDDRRPTKTNQRPTSGPGPFAHVGKYQMAIVQRVIRSTSCLVLRWRGFGDGGSNGAVSGSLKSNMAASGHFAKKLQTAIYQHQQRVNTM